MSVIIKLTGVITDIFAPEIRGNFEKSVMWIQESGTDPRREHWAIEFWQGDATTPEGFKRGETVCCTVDIKGKHWVKDGKEGIITTLKCFKIERIQSASAAAPKQQSISRPAAPPAPPITPQKSPSNEPLDDCPF